MKLMYCQDCGDVVAPGLRNREPQRCACRRHSVWWENGGAGVLRLEDHANRTLPYPARPRAYVIGLSNSILREPREGLNAEIVQELIDRHPESYLFKQWRSLIIRIRPGESSDTAWAHFNAPESPQ